MVEKGTANSSIPLNRIQIDDVFFNKYVKLVKEVIIPYQWEVLNDRLEDVETSHCIENFKIAAGEAEGEFQGAVFQDTDVAKWLEAVGFVLSMEPDAELDNWRTKPLRWSGGLSRMMDTSTHILRSESRMPDGVI